MNKMTSDAGVDLAHLECLADAVEKDIAAGLYHGGNFIVARHGKVVFNRAFGHAYPDQKRPMTLDAVFNILSVTKAFTNTLIFRAFERGQLALTTRVVSVIPEFGGPLRDDLTLFHLLTHTSGMAPQFNPYPDSRLDRLDEMVAALCKTTQFESLPGERVNYSPMAGHVLMGEMLQRTDFAKRRYRDIVAQDIFTPLGMKDTWIGLRPDLRDRKLVLDWLPTRGPMQHLSNNVPGQHGAFEDEQAEMPWVGAISTVGDLHRFAEMLRRGGELDGVHIISPAMIERATQNHTGDMPNELYRRRFMTKGWPQGPAYIGLGFSLRGDVIFPHQFGTLTSPRTFGNYGAGSQVFWVDPVSDMTFVGCTAGVMDELDNIERFQKLSDIAISSAI